MAILFKTILRPEPGVAGGGNPKFYATIEREQPVDLRKFVNEVSRACTLNRADVHAAVQAFLELIPSYLADGKIVYLGDLGSFYATINSRGEDSEVEVTSSSIKKANVRFRPGPEMKNLVSNFAFRKVGPTLTVVTDDDDDQVPIDAAA
ncbi:MAG: HU family DNA-binding protein [Bacteroidota bacterium]